MNREATRKEREEDKKNTKDLKNKNPTERRKAEETEMEKEVIRAYRMRQQNMERIGSFKFDIDDGLDMEILTADQVFEDLDEIKNMKEKTGDQDGNSAYKSLIMAMYTRGKKKKKR